MNIKSLILGSAAALVAGGAAQAADLPVAEPVDYVKVCNAYGAGYHFIPGTDTCLKVSGYVRAEFRFNERNNSRDANGVLDANDRADAKTNIYAKASLNFTAKEETELGTLVAFMRLEGSTDSTSAGVSNLTSNDGFNKYYLSIGGLYAGLTDSAANITSTDVGMYGSTIADHDTGALGYNMDLGNGVTLGVALENSKRAAISGGTATYAGQSLPDVVAGLSIAQGWGSAKIGGAIHTINYDSVATSIDNDYGFYVGAGVSFNLDMLSAGSSLGLSAGYGKGAMGFVGGTNDATLVGTQYKLNDAYKFGAALKYAWASNFNTVLTGSYFSYNDRANTADYKSWDVGFMAEYLPVNNLIVRAGVKYGKTDYSSVSGKKDVGSWEGKLRLQRNF